MAMYSLVICAASQLSHSNAPYISMSYTSKLRQSGQTSISLLIVHVTYTTLFGTRHYPSFPLSGMFNILFQVIIVYAFSFAFCKLVRRYLINSALDNLPGPPPQSFLFGDCFNSLILETAFLLSTQSPGVSPQIFNPKGLEFHKEISQKCTTFQFPRTLMLTPCRW